MNKIKISYELHSLDEQYRPNVEALIKALMDWVQITENEWLVLSNRLNAVALQAEIEKELKSKFSKVSVVNLKKKTKIINDGYLNAKNNEASEMLFTARY